MGASKDRNGAETTGYQTRDQGRRDEMVWVADV